MSNLGKASGPYKQWMNDGYDETNITRTTKWHCQNLDTSDNITNDRLSIYSEDSSPTETSDNGSTSHGISNELIDPTDEDFTTQTLSCSYQSEEHLQTEVDTSEIPDVAGYGNDFDFFEEQNNNEDAVDFDDPVLENCDNSKPVQVCNIYFFILYFYLSIFWLKF